MKLTNGSSASGHKAAIRQLAATRIAAASAQTTAPLITPRLTASRETRRHPAPPATPVGPASKSGKKVVSRPSTASRRVIGSRTSRPDSSSSLSRWPRSVGAQSGQAEHPAEQFLFDLQNLNATPGPDARSPREQAVA